MKKNITVTFCIVVILLFCQPQMAVSSDHMTSDQNNIQENEQRRFHKGQTNAGFSVGPGFGVEMFGSGVKHDLILLFAHYGKVISGPRAVDKWNHGNWEIVGEVFGGTQFNPDDSYLVGLDTLLRYNFLPFEDDNPWTFFADFGGGVSMTDIGGPDLSDGFQFNIQMNAGTHYFIKKDLAVTGKVKGLHLSNAGLDHPNNGLNSFFIMLGLTWFF